MAASQRAPDEQNEEAAPSRYARRRGHSHSLDLPGASGLCYRPPRIHQYAIEREERSAGATLDVENDVIIDEATHYTEVLYNHTSETWKYSLAVDYEYNYLYILAAGTAPVILNLNTNEHIPYVGRVEAPSSVSVDQETHDLYISASDGIYKYKPRSGEERIVGAAGVGVYDLYFNNGVLYYIDDDKDKISTLINGQSDELVDMQYQVYALVIDNEGVMFFINTSGLCMREMNSDYAVYYDKSIMCDVTVDTNGTVYFATDDGIYEIIKYNTSYRKVVSIEAVKDVEAIALDKNNNIIYSDRNKVYRLKPKADVNITNTMDIIKQMETKLDVMDTKMDKLVNDHVEMQKSMSQKIDKLETDQVKILNSVTNISTLITDIAERLSVIGKQGQNK